MADDRRFSVVVTVAIKDTTSGTPTGFFDSEVKYTDLPYDGVLAVEEVLMNGLQALAKKGGELKKK